MGIKPETLLAYNILPLFSWSPIKNRNMKLCRFVYEIYYNIVMEVAIGPDF